MGVGVSGFLSAADVPTDGVNFIARIRHLVMVPCTGLVRKRCLIYIRTERVTYSTGIGLLEPTDFQIEKGDVQCRARAGFDDGFWQAVIEDRWEPHTFVILERFLDEKHSYIDIGAWIGPTVLYACQLARMVYALEPDPVAHAELLANLELNRPKTDNVTAVQQCLAPQDGTVAFGSRSEAGDSMSSLLFGQEATSWNVEGITFERFVQQHEITDCNFIKMDIEGGEYVVLPTMRRYLQKHEPTLYLSLHPCFLGPIEEPGFINRCRRFLVRLTSMLKILGTLRVYSYWYDVHGNRVHLVPLLMKACRLTDFELVLTTTPYSSGTGPVPGLGG